MAQDGNMGTRQKTPFFYLLFPLSMFVTFISEFEKSQNFQKVDTMRLLKIYIKFCPPVTAKCSRLQLMD